MYFDSPITVGKIHQIQNTFGGVVRDWNTERADRYIVQLIRCNLSSSKLGEIWVQIAMIENQKFNEEAKTMSRVLISTICSLALMLGISTQANAGCGNITVAEMNWASAEFMANVDKIILEKGYGCKVELVAGATMPTFTSMNEKGQPDIAAELWANAVANPLKKAIAEGRLHAVNGGPITGLGEGWWLPPHTVKKHPELKTALDV